MAKKKKVKKKEKDDGSIAAPAISFLLGVVVGRHGVPVGIHVTYIIVIVLSLLYAGGAIQWLVN